jgi:dephospho-CoA kinase
MIVIGLTGSIGMGKSTAAQMMRRLRLPVFDADAEVHRLMAKGGKAVLAIQAEFPEVVIDGAVDRKALGRVVFGRPDRLKALEAILHPLVRHAEQRFIATCVRRRARFAVLDIPLLFEAGRDVDCDVTIVVTAPAFLQRQRVLRRPGMTEERLRQILAHQMPDREKRQRADFVIETGLGKGPALSALKSVLRALRNRGVVW